MGVCNETIKKRNEPDNNSFYLSEASKKSNSSIGTLNKKYSTIPKYIYILYKNINNYLVYMTFVNLVQQ